MSCNVSYEELSRHEAGELVAERARFIEQHMEQCAVCRRRIQAIRRTDSLIRLMPRHHPTPRALLQTRHALAEYTRTKSEPEIMTLEEVAAFLQLTMDDMEEIIDELPAFELAGRIRVRRSKLIEWIERREVNYKKSSIESQVSQILAGF